MTSPINSERVRRFFRVGKFKVPAAARAEFLSGVRAIHAFLRTLPGFVEDFILEQTGGPGAFNFVTVVIWRDEQSLASAKAAAAERYRAIGFDPAEFLRRLNIDSDLAIYAVASD